MGNCASCGNELGSGRFCTSCGHPVESDHGWRTDTAERLLPSTPPPRTPPPAQAGASATGPRFALYADEVAAPPARSAQPPTGPPSAPPAAAPPPRRRARWPLWVGAAVVLLVAAGLGISRLLGDDPADEPTPASTTKAQGDRESGSERPSRSPGDVSGAAEVTVPETAPANQDVDGNPVEYVAANLLDGVPETAWRMEGDGTGEQLTVTLGEETTLRRVGMINGYAKMAEDAQGRTLDWYHGNRRVLRAEWVFDDGTTVTQRLKDTVAVQWVDVDATTSAVTLRLLDVSGPGDGRAARNFTAISEVAFLAAD